MKHRNNLLLYILINIVVSAVTTSGVLFAWDRFFKAELDQAGSGLAAPTTVASPLNNALVLSPADIQAAVTLAPQAQPPAALVPVSTPTLLPVDQPVIEFISVIAAGDLEQEVVLLRRVGEGNLRLVGWQLVGEGGAVFTFPEQPELILYMDGAVQVHTKPGEDTATDMYWNHSEPAWRSGEMIRLLDSQGIERTTYRVP